MDSTTLIHGDCRKELRKLATASVDAVVTDPPYPCIDRAYGKMTETAWLDMMKAVVKECRRVLNRAAAQCSSSSRTIGDVGAMRLWAWRFMLQAAEEWNMVQDCYWWCINAMPTHSSSRKVGLMRQGIKWCVWLGSPDCYRKQDAVLWDVSDATAALRWEDRCLQRRPGGQSVRAGRTAEASLERGGSTPFNLLPVAAANPNGHHGHPASTPYDLAAWWCRYILPPGGVLLDPFVGSGTMLAAALDCGASRVIGIDKEAKYLEDGGESESGENSMTSARTKAKETVMPIPIVRLRPNPWGLEVGPPLSAEDDEALRASIAKSGIQIPLIAWRRGKRLVVLSGSQPPAGRQGAGTEDSPGHHPGLRRQERRQDVCR